MKDGASHLRNNKRSAIKTREELLRDIVNLHKRIVEGMSVALEFCAKLALPKHPISRVALNNLMQLPGREIEFPKP